MWSKISSKARWSRLFPPEAVHWAEGDDVPQTERDWSLVRDLRGAVLPMLASKRVPINVLLLTGRAISKGGLVEERRCNFYLALLSPSLSASWLQRSKQLCYSTCSSPCDFLTHYCLRPLDAMVYRLRFLIPWGKNKYFFFNMTF